MTAAAVSDFTGKTTIPLLDGGLPLIGHALELRRDPVRFIQRGRDQLGDIFSFQLLYERIHVLTGAAGNKLFFQAPDSVLSPREAYQWSVPLFGKGVAYDLEPDAMEKQLRIIRAGLRDERLQTYAPIIDAEVNQYLDRWGDEGETDLFAAIHGMMTQALTHCLIGTDAHKRLTAELMRGHADLGGWVSFGLNIIAMVTPDAPLPAMRRRKQAQKRIIDLICEVIAERRASGVAVDDFLNTLMTARDHEDKPLTDKVMAGLLLTLLYAGRQSAVLGIWAGLLMLENPRFLDGVMAEQRTVLGERVPTVAALRQLVQFEACIKEAERLYPPFVMLMRKVHKAMEFNGHVIPAGDWAIVSPAVTHRIPGIFADPQRYDPGRFLPGREEDRRTPYSLIAFSSGKHHCLGLPLAYVLIKMVWGTLLKRFELTLVEHSLQPDYASLMVGPRGPCRIRYRRRAAEI